MKQNIDWQLLLLERSKRLKSLSRRIPTSHNPTESKRGCRVDTMLVISFTSRLRTVMVSSIIVFGHATAHAMHACKSERAHPSATIFLDNTIANNDIVVMMTKLMITKRNERMEPKSQNLSITSSSEIFYSSY